MAEIIPACILFAVATVAFVLSFRAFRGKGFLLNNAYIYASKKDRETMDKRPYYRQSAIVFGMIGLIFLLNGLSVLLAAKWITYAKVAVMIATAAYAMASGIAIEKKK